MTTFEEKREQLKELMMKQIGHRIKLINFAEETKKTLIKERDDLNLDGVIKLFNLWAIKEDNIGTFTVKINELKREMRYDPIFLMSDDKEESFLLFEKISEVAFEGNFSDQGVDINGSELSQWMKQKEMELLPQVKNTITSFVFSSIESAMQNMCSDLNAAVTMRVSTNYELAHGSNSFNIFAGSKLVSVHKGQLELLTSEI